MKCCICGQEILDAFGNDPWPVKDEGKCCDNCNLTVVLKARLDIINTSKKENKEGK